MSDLQLLEQYVRTRSEEAFTDLVREHVDWVYASALRQVRDAHLAEDVTQGVFIALARQAKLLKLDRPLSPWLLRITRYASVSALRSQARRRHHEQKAAAMKSESTSMSEAEWGELAPMLDDLVDRLREKDREAILLRFYQKKSLAEVGRGMGVSEEAARKRVDRAVEKLRGMFGRKGLAVGSVAVLAGGLAAQTTQAAPASLASAAVASGLAAGQGAAVAANLLAVAKGALTMTHLLHAKSLALVTALVVLLAGPPAALLVKHALAASPPPPSPAETDSGKPSVSTILTRLKASLEVCNPVAVTQDIDGAIVDQDGRLVNGSSHSRVRLFRDAEQIRIDEDMSGFTDVEHQHLLTTRKSHEIIADGMTVLWDSAHHGPAVYRASKDTERLRLLRANLGCGAFLDGRLDDFPDQNVAELLLSARNAVVAAETATVDGHECYLVQAQLPEGSLRAWVSPSQEYGLVRYAFVAAAPFKDQRIAGKTIDVRVQLRQIGDTFVPWSGELIQAVTLARGGSTKGKFSARRSELQLNPDFAAMKAFMLDLPNGTLVARDDAPGMLFEFRDGKLQPHVDPAAMRPIDDLASGGLGGSKRADALRGASDRELRPSLAATPLRETPRDNADSMGYGRWFVSGAVVLALLGTGLWCWRRAHVGNTRTAKGAR